MDALGWQREEFHIAVLSGVYFSFHRLFFISTLFKPKLFARNSVKLKHKEILSFLRFVLLFYLNDVQREFK